MGKDYYTLLGVGRDANEQELKKSEAGSDPVLLSHK